MYIVAVLSSSLLSSKKEYLFPLWHTAVHVLIHLWNEKLQPCTPQCILFQVHVEPGLLFGKRMPCLFVFEMFVFGNSSFVSRLLALFGMTQKKLHVFLREWQLYSSRRLVGKKTTRFWNDFFYLFWMSGWPLSLSTVLNLRSGRILAVLIHSLLRAPARVLCNI